MSTAMTAITETLKGFDFGYSSNRWGAGEVGRVQLRQISLTNDFKSPDTAPRRNFLAIPKSDQFVSMCRTIPLHAGFRIAQY